MSDDRPYKIAYNVKYVPEGMTKEQILEQGLGGTDALFVCSLIFPEDGSLSSALASLDGRTGRPLEDEDIFKIWTLMAKGLSESETLPPGKKALALSVFETVREIILKARG